MLGLIGATSMIFDKDLHTVFEKLANKPAGSGGFLSKLKQGGKIIFSKHGLNAALATLPVYLALRYTKKRQLEKYKEISRQAIRSDPELAKKWAKHFSDKHKLGDIPVQETDHPRVVSGFAAYQKDGKPIILTPKDKSKSPLQIDDPAIYLHELGHARGMATKHPVTQTAKVLNHPIAKLSRLPLAFLKPKAGHALGAASGAALVAEEYRASKDALEYIAEHGSPKEQTRARRLLKAIHAPYVLESGYAALNPTILGGAFIAGIKQSIQAEAMRNAVRARKTS